MSSFKAQKYNRHLYIILATGRLNRRLCDVLYYVTNIKKNKNKIAFSFIAKHIINELIIS